MRIQFELDPSDVARFDAVMQCAQEMVACAEEIDVLDAARAALLEIPVSKAPGYIRKRLMQVDTLINMLEDDAWSLPQHDRCEVLKALIYFSDPDDLVPDHIGMIGLLDDVIMLELVLRKLKSVLIAYQQFCEFRNKLETSGDKYTRTELAKAIAEKRASLFKQIHSKRVSR